MAWGLGQWPGGFPGEGGDRAGFDSGLGQASHATPSHSPQSLIPHHPPLPGSVSGAGGRVFGVCAPHRPAARP